MEGTKGASRDKDAMLCWEWKETHWNAIENPLNHDKSHDSFKWEKTTDPSLAYLLWKEHQANARMLGPSSLQTHGRRRISGGTPTSHFSTDQPGYTCASYFLLLVRCLIVKDWYSIKSSIYVGDLRVRFTCCRPCKDRNETAREGRWGESQSAD